MAKAVQTRSKHVFQFSLLKQKTPLETNSTRSNAIILAGLFQAARKVGLMKVEQTRFLDFPHRGKKKKHPWERIPRGQFHATILAGHFQAAQKGRLTKVVQSRSKWVLSTFPIVAKGKNTFGNESHEVGFMAPFWLDFSRQRKRAG